MQDDARQRIGEDGLEEPFGEARLHEVVRTCVGLDCDEVVQRVVRAAVDYQRGILRDDIAVLALRARPYVAAAP